MNLDSPHIGSFMQGDSRRQVSESTLPTANTHVERNTKSNSL